LGGQCVRIFGIGGAFPGDHRIPVPLEHDQAGRIADAKHTLTRSRAVGDEVAQADTFIGWKRQKVIQRRQVAVNVAKKQNARLGRHSVRGCGPRHTILIPGNLDFKT
jgi:hypothetical protein